MTKQKNDKVRVEQTNDDTYRSELKEAVPGYLKAGLPVTVAEGKDPGRAMGKQWQQKKLSEDQAATRIDQTPHPAIGIMLGPGGAIDFDIDGEEERKAFMDLCDNDPPIMPQYTSGREGGEHRLAKFDPRLEAIGKATVKYSTKNVILSNSITVRIGCKFQEDGSLSGAHSIVPPSLHAKKSKDSNEWGYSGKQYQWREGLDLETVGLPELPDRVINKLLEAAEQKKSGRRKSRSQSQKSTPVDSAVEAMLTCTAEMTDQNDGSKRLYTAACRAVGHDLSDEQAIAAIRKYEAELPFPSEYSDEDILDRVRQSEASVTRGIELELSNGVVYVSDELDGNGNPKIKIAPLSMPDVLREVRTATGDWPRCVGEALFIHDKKHGIRWFKKPPALFGWLRSLRKVVWHSGIAQVKYEELFHELIGTSQKYDAVELLPHEPQIPTHYYACETPPKGDGSLLRELLDRFRPATPIDRDLIQAALMTAFWGGRPGARPAFVISAPEGRGVGKTKLAQIIGHLAGGVLDVSSNEEISVLKQRFLSPEAQPKRVALIDNIKTPKFSWAELESLITASEISGKRLYVGEATRPNTFTWLLTLNGINLSPDMAQRSIIINLVRGDNHGTWYEETLKFIEQNQQELIGDIIGALQAEQLFVDEYSRWAEWEREVLSRLPEPGEAQKVILERQGVANSDLDEGGLIEDWFESKLMALKYDPKTAQVRIPVQVVAEWYRAATNERNKKTGSVTRVLKQMACEGQLNRLSYDSSRNKGRAFIWTGEAADIHSGSICNRLMKEELHPVFGG